MRTYRYKRKTADGWLRVRAEHRPGPDGGYYELFDDGSTPATYRRDGVLARAEKYHNDTYNQHFWRIDGLARGHRHAGFGTLKEAVGKLLDRLQFQRLP